jgi:hypothetical protein
MNRCLKITTLVGALSFLSAFGSLSFAGTYAWEFNDRREVSGWETSNVDSAYIDGDHLVVKGEIGFLRIISPEGLNIPSSKNALWLRVKSEKKGPGKILFGSLRVGKRLEKEFWVEGGGIYRDYRIYTGDILPTGFLTDRFTVDFPPEEVEAEIDFIRFYEPGFSQLFHLLWSQFWEPEKITGTTINFVTTPYIGSFSFLTVLYVLIIILSIGILLASIIRKAALTWRTVVRAIIISFLLWGGLFALRMDYNLLDIWLKDRRDLSGKNINERIPYVFYTPREFFDFINSVKSMVPEGEKVRPATRPNFGVYELLAKYYLLPVKTSVEGDYLWAYNLSGVMDVYFDKVTRSLMEGNRVVASPVRPVATFGDAGVLYKVEKEEE